MTTATTSQTTTTVDVSDLIARLTIATEFLTEMRDGALGSERTHLASKIEGIQRCAKAVQREFGFLADLPDVESLFANLDPGSRSITESLDTTELGISKGVALALNYARNPVPVPVST
ncbi:hypothetical protein [Ornithinimicrobium murale]|uniref:hypothetical protein n=1 Tax=Ornithinimicrobium murale TaxID=1050153 RepID=UPI000E0D34BE|nr:hypothetical protein [Ornithinimicrobium murale]